MELTHAGMFDFKGSNGFPSRCYVRIWRGRGSLPVVIATELPDNPGQSITNAAEALASQVWARLLPEAREGFVWVERYLAYGRSYHSSAHDGDIEETLDLVTFDIVRGRELTMRESLPPWRRVSRAYVEELIGASLSMQTDEV